LVGSTLANLPQAGAKAAARAINNAGGINGHDALAGATVAHSWTASGLG
jgi:ABC-type branched-subunit amino acid transport system substrate-binding protein